MAPLRHVEIAAAPHEPPSCSRRSDEADPLWFQHATRLLLALGLVLLTSCTPSKPPADITIINGAEPESLDPAVATIQPDLRIVRTLFEGLTRLDPETAQPIPGLAERWDISPDGTIYTFHLRSNAVWSTGQPVTAGDFVYSWLRVLEPLTGAEYAGQLFFIRNAEAFNAGRTNAAAVGIRELDPHTLRVELEAPVPFFLDLAAFPTLTIVPRWHVEKYGDRWLMHPPVPTSGTYTLDFWKLQDRIRVRKNPRHWDAANIRNNLVDFLPMDSPTGAINLYETGEADIIWDKSLIPSELLDVLTKRADCHTFTYLGTFFYRYNVTRKPFDDVRVRKALAMAVDKRRLVERITRGGEQITSHFTPKGLAHYDPPDGWGYDPDQARRLLAEAGYPGGKGFPSFHYLTKVGKTDEQIGIELQAMWKKELNIEMELRVMETKVYFTTQSALDYDISRSSWIGDYPDPNTFLDMFMSNNGNNRTGWKSARYDDLLREANQQLDPKKRGELLRQAETLLVQEDLPVVPLYFYAGINFFDTNVIDGIYFNLIDEHPTHAIRKKVRSP